MARFDEIFQRVIGHEGGYSHDPRDPGGETNYGITWKTLELAIGRGIVPSVKVRQLELDQAKAIYRALYWAEIRGDELPPPIDEFAFDFAVNSGIGRASTALQAAAGALQDGRIGPRTLEAVRTKKPIEIVRLMFVERAMSFALSPNERTFGRGWFARLFDVTAQAVRSA